MKTYNIAAIPATASAPKSSPPASRRSRGWPNEVDAATMRMVLKPASLDVMVATNLHADILSDLAAALSGSLGIAPTANLNPVSMLP